MWSRVGPGTVIVVVPSAARPARATQPRTWALATGSRCSSARKRRCARGCGRARARRSSRPSAPIARSGAATRSIGRRESDASPTSVALPRAGRRAPRRAAASSCPELPQSSSRHRRPGAGRHRASHRPRATTRTCPPSSSDEPRRPRRAVPIAPSVERTSAPGPVERDAWTARSPSPPNISARCATDLSDGSRSVPRSRAAARDRARSPSPSLPAAPGSRVRAVRRDRPRDRARRLGRGWRRCAERDTRRIDAKTASRSSGVRTPPSDAATPAR